MPERSSVALTPRDLALFWSLHQARYLTAEAIEWLHFPQWRERYARWQEEQAQGSQRRYLVCNQAYTRLQQLQRGGYLHRITRPVALAVDAYRRDADLLCLSEAGARMLAAQRGLELPEVHYGAPRPRSAALLPHHAAVSRVYAAFRAKIESRADLAMTNWRSEHDFQRNADRITVTLPESDGSATQQEQGLEPDGAFFVTYEGGRSLFFVEVERDQPLAKWKRKVWAYEAYHGSAPLRTRWGHPTFTLLGIALDANHQRRLLQATAEALALLYADPQRLQRAQERYLVSTMAQVHPTMIGAGWQELHAIRSGERVTVETGPYEVIR